MAEETPKRSYVIALVLSAAFGYMGADRFYLGYKTLAVIKFLTLGGFGIWYLIDFFLIGFDSLKDADGQSLEHRY